MTDLQNEGMCVCGYVCRLAGMVLCVYVGLYTCMSFCSVVFVRCVVSYGRFKVLYATYIVGSACTARMLCVFVCHVCYCFVCSMFCVLCMFVCCACHVDVMFHIQCRFYMLCVFVMHVVHMHVCMLCTYTC